jgi:hypothetical protein
MKLLGIIGVGIGVTSAADQIVCIREILEKKWGKMRIHCLFIDLKKVCDSVRKEVLYSIVIEFWGTYETR